ncbi:hypothetical protein EIP91_010612 [Steccherinum ochraceum]|uniref:Uncharacterized protein n=1 Tax=Steccherinum ochraceum TaxID=92696 RepID=A0A4V6N701_9APHY|nr:hypothetical protein EIP91_010612 [Steccherinum ochraceum]
MIKQLAREVIVVVCQKPTSVAVANHQRQRQARTAAGCRSANGALAFSLLFHNVHLHQGRLSRQHPDGRRARSGRDVLENVFGSASGFRGAAGRFALLLLLLSTSQPPIVLSQRSFEAVLWRFATNSSPCFVLDGDELKPSCPTPPPSFPPATSPSAWPREPQKRMARRSQCEAKRTEIRSHRVCVVRPWKPPSTALHPPILVPTPFAPLQRVSESTTPMPDDGSQSVRCRQPISDAPSVPGASIRVSSTPPISQHRELAPVNADFSTGLASPTDVPAVDGRHARIRLGGSVFPIAVSGSYLNEPESYEDPAGRPSSVKISVFGRNAGNEHPEYRKTGRFTRRSQPPRGPCIRGVFAHFPQNPGMRRPQLPSGSASADAKPFFRKVRFGGLDRGRDGPFTSEGEGLGQTGDWMTMVYGYAFESSPRQAAPSRPPDSPTCTQRRAESTMPFPDANALHPRRFHRPGIAVRARRALEEVPPPLDEFTPTRAQRAPRRRRLRWGCSTSPWPTSTHPHVRTIRGLARTRVLHPPHPQPSRPRPRFPNSPKPTEPILTPHAPRFHANASL